MRKTLTIPNEVLLGEVSELLASGNRVMLKTKGSSMRPFIEGDRDSVELVRKDCYCEGDIVLAEVTPGRYVLHRLIADSGRITLKGDGNLTAVETCRSSDICGAVSMIVRGDGRTVDCSTARFRRLSRMWRKSPYLFRRLVLGILRRL